MYYKFPLNKLLQLITLNHNEFMVDSHIISLDTVMSYIENNDFIEKCNKNSYEESIYNIILAISNPEEIHDNKIVIEQSDNGFYVLQGIEKIIAALHHKEPFLIVKSDSLTEDNIEKYSTIESIDYSFTSFVPIANTELFVHKNLNNKYIDYLIENEERNNDCPWDDKNYIISQIKANRFDIKKFIPVNLLDEKFILELIEVNYNLLHNWYYILEEDYNSFLYKTFLSLTEDKKPIFIKYINNQIKFLIEDIAKTLELESHEPHEVERINAAKSQRDKIFNTFCQKEDLLHFIVSNTDSSIMYNLILILPNEVYKDEKITFGVFKYFNYRLLNKLEPDFFKNEESLAKLFVSIDDYLPGKKEWVYEKVVSFFQDNPYTYLEWHNNELMFEKITSIVAEKRSQRYYFDAIFFKTLYRLLSNSVKKNVNCLYNLLRLKPDSFTFFEKDMQKEKKLIDYYLQNSELYEETCPVNHEYIFTIENPELISKIVNAFSYLLFEKDCPSSWTKNIEYYKGKAINYLQKFPEHIKEQIFSDYEYVVTMIYNRYYLYPDLSLELRTDRKILDTYIDRSSLNYLYNIPQKMLLNKTQCLCYFEQNPNILLFIPENIKNSINFILKIYNHIDNILINTRKFTYLAAVEESYPDIAILLKKFNIEDNMYNFLNEHFQQQNKYDFYKRLDIKLDSKMNPDIEIKKTKL